LSQHRRGDGADLVKATIVTAAVPIEATWPLDAIVAVSRGSGHGQAGTDQETGKGQRNCARAARNG
jgi:hypothetical protein